MIYRKSAAPEPLELGLTSDQRFELVKMRLDHSAAATVAVLVFLSLMCISLMCVVGWWAYVAHAEANRACAEGKR